MKHEEAFSLMMDALDGVLAPVGALELEQHLALCPQCYAEWDGLQQVDRLLLAAAMAPAPAGLSQRVLAKLDLPSSRRVFGMLFALSASSLLALLLVAVPAGVALLGLWTVYNEPARFTELLIWLNQLLGVSGSLLGAAWITLRLFFAEIAGNPVALVWTLAAGVAVGVWAHLLRQPAPVRARNGS